MKFGPVPVIQAEGKILAHNISRGDHFRSLRKGRSLSPGDIAALVEAGYQTVYIAELESGDLDENSAARQLAAALVGPTAKNLVVKEPAQGRTSLAARTGGVLLVDTFRLNQINNCEGITVATLQTRSIVTAGETVTALKIIPYAIPAMRLANALSIAGEGHLPLVELREFSLKRVGIIYSASLRARERTIKSFEPPMHRLVESFDANIELSAYACLSGDNDEEALAEKLRQQASQGAEIIIIAGETSTMDNNDVVPLAVRRAGGNVISVGAPIEPGNLVTLAYLGSIPVLGVPGCIRGAKPTPVSKILALLMAGEHLQRADITGLGHGGLWEREAHGS